MSRYNKVPGSISIISGILIFMVAIWILFSAGCQKDDVNDPLPPPLDEQTETIGPSGGTVQLENGIKIEIPAGALATETEITLTSYDAAEFLSVGDENKFVIGCKPEGLSLAEMATIYFPVPEAMGDEFEARAGYIEPESGFLEPYAHTGLTLEGKSYISIETGHFSKYYSRYFGRLPNSTMHDVPFYHQGGSPFCWTACMKMMTEAFQRSPLEMDDIIGKVQIDPSGLAFFNLYGRMSIRDQLKILSGTTAEPEGELYSRGTVYLMKDDMRHLLANGYPVMVFTPVEGNPANPGHAFMVVGYEGSDFFIHDPATTMHTGNLGYQRRSWESFKTNTLFATPFVTMAIPAKITPSDQMQCVNIAPDEELYFRLPGTESLSKIRYEYDYTQPRGYTFLDNDNKKVDTLPAHILEIVVNSAQLINASRTEGKYFNVTCYVNGVTDKKKKYITSAQRIFVGANTLVYFKEKIPLDVFTKDLNSVEEFRFQMIAADDNGHNLDEFNFNFHIQPPAMIRVGFNLKARNTDDGIDYDFNYVAGDFPGVWAGQYFVFNQAFSVDDSDFTISGSAKLNPEKTRILLLKYTYKVYNDTYSELFGNYNETLYTFFFADVPLVREGNNLVADVNGSPVCDFLFLDETNLVFTSENLGEINIGKDLEWKCDETASLYVSMPGK